jgi:hypothetical protein
VKTIRPDLAWNAFNGIEGTLTSYVLPPKVAAELYRALGDIPDVTVDKDAIDAAGRHGPAFVLTDKDYPGGGWTARRPAMNQTAPTLMP